MHNIGLVIAAAGLWAGAGLTARPKNRDEQTLVGGAIWSQIIIPIGLMISRVVKETVDMFVEGYYLVTGILLLWITGIVLIVHEWRRYKRRAHNEELKQEMRKIILGNPTEGPPGSSSEPQTSHRQNDTGKIIYPYDKAYYAIGVLCFLAGSVKLAELIMFVILGYS